MMGLVFIATQTIDICVKIGSRMVLRSLSGSLLSSLDHFGYLVHISHIVMVDIGHRFGICNGRGLQLGRWLHAQVWQGEGIGFGEGIVGVQFLSLFVNPLGLFIRRSCTLHWRGRGDWRVSDFGRDGLGLDFQLDFGA